MRDLFINGFRNRDGLNSLADNKSRAADESRQIIASILREYYKYEKKGGERYFLAIDTRENRHNPLHNIWKSKAFSSSDIMLYFYILDCVKHCEEIQVPARKDYIYDYVLNRAAYDENNAKHVYENSKGEEFFVADSLSRSKLDDKIIELTELGILCKNDKVGFSYSLEESFDIDLNLLDYASEVMPVSTVGSYLLDRTKRRDSLFAFKHNMISQVLDDDVMYMLFETINDHREVSIKIYNRLLKKYYEQIVVPLIIVRNVQNGRQYLACWSDEEEQFKSIRLDYIRIEKTTKNKGQFMGSVRDDYNELKEKCKEQFKYSWGVSLSNTKGKLNKVSFTIQVDEETKYIANRLYREKRGGIVEDLGNWKYRFTISLYDSVEILPWVTSFYGNIVDIEMDDKEALDTLKGNFEAMINNHLADTEEGDSQSAQSHGSFLQRDI